MKGILFKPEMIKALVVGRKTITRRLQGFTEINIDPDGWECTGRNPDGTVWGFENYRLQKQVLVKPRYLPGEVVYIKEAHYAYGYWTLEIKGWTFRRCPDMKVSFASDSSLWEHASTKPSEKEMWYKRSPLFLPSEDARYFIQITDVRPERLQEITASDCVKEGIKIPDLTAGTDFDIDGNLWSQGERKFIKAYADLWDSINKANQWASNPWLWHIEFKMGSFRLTI